jgi:hypothetical protein
MRNFRASLPFSVLALTLFWAHASHAQGGPPMMTDDPATPGPGHWEVNIAATAEHRHASSEGESPLLDVNYGIGERVQLKYEVPWVSQREDGKTRFGLGNSLLGVKWRFWDAGHEGWQISTYPQIEVRNPGSHSVERGLAEEGTGVVLPLEFQREYESVGINFEVGRELHSRGEDSWFGGCVTGREISERLELMAEVHGQAASRDSALALNFGGRFAMNEQGTLLVSMGHELYNDFEGRTALFGYIGWQMTR